MGCHQGDLASEKLFLTLRFDVAGWHLPALSGSHPECPQGTCIPEKIKLTAILNTYTPAWTKMLQGQRGALTFLLPATLAHIGYSSLALSVW